ncbi:MAG TPA: recombinase RecA, partial [Burkholderiaceae bacterium]|nr:recombinase RecA [Burkholderiaceae bacterium]
GQGKDNAREFLRENEALAREIENKVRAEVGIPQLPAGEGAAGKTKAAKDSAAAGEAAKA